MKTLGTTMVCNRGEVFTMTRGVEDSNGVPFVILKAWTNPYILISVSSTLYRQAGAWSKNYWLSLEGYPTFDCVTPYYIEDLDAEPQEDDRLYYTMDSDGEKAYYRYDRDATEYKPYRFRFSKVFTNKDTREWVESQYSYQIRVVSGDKAEDGAATPIVNLEEHASLLQPSKLTVKINAGGYYG